MANNYMDNSGGSKDFLHLLLFLIPLCFPWPFVIMAGKVDSRKFRRLGLAYFIAGIILVMGSFLSLAADSEGVFMGFFLIGIMIHLFALAQCCAMMGEYRRLLNQRRSGLMPYNNMYNAPYNSNMDMYGQSFGGYGSQPRIPMDDRSMMNMPQQQYMPHSTQSMPATQFGQAQQYGGMGMQSGGVSLQKPQGYPDMQGGYNAPQAMGSGIQSNATATAMSGGIRSAADNISNAMPGGMMVNTRTQGRLNINTCTEEELAALPGLNIIDAKKAISHRQQYGDFGSIEELVVLLGLKPHIAAPLYDIIYCEGSGAPQNMSGAANAGSGRRTLDI